MLICKSNNNYKPSINSCLLLCSFLGKDDNKTEDTAQTPEATYVETTNVEGERKPENAKVNDETTAVDESSTDFKQDTTISDPAVLSTGVDDSKDELIFQEEMPSEITSDKKKDENEPGEQTEASEMQKADNKPAFDNLPAVEADDHVPHLVKTTVKITLCDDMLVLQWRCRHFNACISSALVCLSKRHFTTVFLLLA